MEQEWHLVVTPVSQYCRYCLGSLCFDITQELEIIDVFASLRCISAEEKKATHQIIPFSLEFYLCYAQAWKEGSGTGFVSLFLKTVYLLPLQNGFYALCYPRTFAFFTTLLSLPPLDLFVSSPLFLPLLSTHPAHFTSFPGSMLILLQDHSAQTHCCSPWRLTQINLGLHKLTSNLEYSLNKQFK